MSIAELLKEIDSNQQMINDHGKLNAQSLKKINYRFRLDWNYHSNRMEGGTLTRAETRSVMIGNIDVKGKPLKDILEMDGHDRVVLEIFSVGKDEKRISERRIKSIHTKIMSEDDPEKRSKIGTWKTHANEIINYKGEKVLFSPPIEVPEQMHKLIDRVNAQLDHLFTKKSNPHPLFITSDFHIDYLNIHPFYDGNGRTARILSNLILISCGYPVIIITEENKHQYYQYLADIQSYGGSREHFYEFIAQRILESQKLILTILNEDDSHDFLKDTDQVQEPSSIYENESRRQLTDLLHLVENSVAENNLNFPLSKQQRENLIEEVLMKMSTVAGGKTIERTND